MMVITFCVHLFIMNYFPEVHNSDCYMFIYFENLNPYLYVLPYIHKNHLFKCTFESPTYKPNSIMYNGNMIL